MGSERALEVYKEMQKGPCLVAMVGLSGSGKSSFVQVLSRLANEAEVVCPDDLRYLFTGDMGNQTANGAVFSTTRLLLKIRSENNLTTIYDATNVKAEYRKGVLEYAGDLPVIAVVMDVSLEDAKLGNRVRSRQVPEEVIDDQYTGMQAVTEEKLLEEGFSKVFIIS